MKLSSAVQVLASTSVMANKHMVSVAVSQHSLRLCKQEIAELEKARDAAAAWLAQAQANFQTLEAKRDTSREGDLILRVAQAAVQIACCESECASLRQQLAHVSAVSPSSVATSASSPMSNKHHYIDKECFKWKRQVCQV